MNQPVTVLTIFGTRPELIKLFPVIRQLRNEASVRNITVCTAQHREMVDDLLDLFSVKVDHDLDIMLNNQTLNDISVRALSNLDPLLKQHRPDLVLVQGDTTTAFIGAFAAFNNKIPVGHVEAGLRSFDKMNPYPEEINRRLISVVAALHFTPTGENAQNLFREGIDRANVFLTGNTVIDALLDIAGRKRGTLEKYLPAQALESQRLILVTAHRRENWGEPLEQLCEGLKTIVRGFPDVRIVYPVHLNPNVRKSVFSILANQDRIHLLDPLPYEPFVEAMAKSHLIITDSGGIQEEGPSLKKPILVFRKVTERPEGLATGGVRLTGTDRENLVREASRLLEDETAYRSMIAEYNPYGDGHAAERILQAILHRFGRAPRPEDFTPSSERRQFAQPA